jgi:formate hydrogenlyase subunit 3/multisubunit Na+/H+ antiporter MnhD subunit
MALLGLPLANYFLPEIMAKRILGFTLTWLILGVLFFPYVWIISYAFIKRSIALEDAEVKEAMPPTK